MRKFFGLSLPCQRHLKSCVICIVVFFVIESIIFNSLVLYIIWNLHSAISDIVSAPGETILDKLAVNPFFAKLIYSGKEGGFVTLLDNTVGRVYMETVENLDGTKQSRRRISRLNDGTAMRQHYINRIGIDVSSSGETMYILERIQNLEINRTKWEKLVIDIGANDGLLSSNSYNFIRWGWSAILVEPQSYQLDLAKRNLHGYISQHKEQRVYFLNAVIGDYDGTAKFKLSPDIVAMESHVVSDGDEAGVIMDVQCYSVKTFAAKFKVPKHFGILSIDAEGFGSMILHQWIKLGYRPMYIIHEDLHDPEDILETTRKLKQAGYDHLTKRGWNNIFEYNPSVSRN
ncbi:uncharacterized protein LOC123555125 [Mercenaria mercenaria]|uniref:uncharacterized protein LOC123555125 n=1 Tax=Mercenaria mercenaria TaxID=6596 RepID=UPI00234F0DD9|nr:uncharacterized protein LOC123555125 [Mercenaria mercenaria]XP_053403359.1 uncharacterized protein LOC123555125 [Mercenaria mercenaria]